MIARFFLFLLLACSVSSCVKKSPRDEKHQIARDPTWYPLLLNSYAIKLNGFTNALVAEIANNQNINLSIIDIPWVNLFEGLDEEKYFSIFSSLPINQITSTKYSFSDPIILLGPVLVVRNDSKATSLLDLKGKIVGINEFSDDALIVQVHPAVIIKQYDKMTAALEDLVQGTVDAVLLDTLEAHSLVPTQYASMLKIVSEPLNTKAIRIVTLKDKNKNLLSYFNQGLSQLHTSGKYLSLRKEFKLN